MKTMSDLREKYRGKSKVHTRALNCLANMGYYENVLIKTARDEIANNRQVPLINEKNVGVKTAVAIYDMLNIPISNRQ